MEHRQLNFKLPHEFGGCGTAYQDQLYGKFNIYTENNDLAPIKPRWTTQNEFRVDLPRNPALDDDDFDLSDALPIMMKKQSSISTHDARIEYSANFQNTILQEFDKQQLPDLE